MVKSKSSLVCLLILAAGLSLIAGCGLKAPPQAIVKDGKTIAPPTNLSYTLDGETVTLTWTHAADAENAKLQPEGFRIFAATKERGGCEGCPFIFKQVGSVAMPEMTFTQPLDMDLHYYFRIQALGEGNVKSKYSKTLHIEYQ